MRFKDISGRKYNYLTAIKIVQSDTVGASWLCKCDCGEEIVLKSIVFTRKTHPQKSCRKCAIKRQTIHGMTNTKEFFAWRGILSRCDDPRSKPYPDYGGRGIRHCKNWAAFKNFFADMGYAPTKKHTIGRIDNDKHYSCGHCNHCNKRNWEANCRWEEWKPQQRNKRNTLYGIINEVKKPIIDWCEEYSMPYMLVTNRMRRGMELIKALTTPLWGAHKRYEYGGKNLTIGEWGKLTGFSKGVIKTRIKLGWDIEDVLTITPKKYKGRKK